MWPRKAIVGRHLSAADNIDIEFEVLDPWRSKDYGSQPLIGCIDDIEDHNIWTLASRYDAIGKGAYGQWGAWLMLSECGWWMYVSGQGGGCKMEDNDGGRTGHPSLFPRWVCFKTSALLHCREELIIQEYQLTATNNNTNDSSSLLGAIPPNLGLKVGYAQTRIIYGATTALSLLRWWIVLLGGRSAQALSYVDAISHCNSKSKSKTSQLATSALTSITLRKPWMDNPSVVFHPKQVGWITRWCSLLVIYGMPMVY